MPNSRWNRQVGNVKPTTASGVKPMKAGSVKTAITESHPNWPSLPGKAGPDRSAGVPEEKVYAYAQGLRGGKDRDRY